MSTRRLDRIAEPWGTRTPFAAGETWPVRVDKGAQVARDQELLDTVSSCHAQTLRGMKWTLTRLKTAAPQVLAG